MKKVVFVIAVCMLFATVVAADPMQVRQYTSSNFSYGSGGEFGVKISGDWAFNPGQSYHPSAKVAGYDFQTFCIEKNETFYPGQYYDVSLSNSAKVGGVGGAIGGEDAISLGTAWLYSQFAKGQLTGYDYDLGADRRTSAGKLQEALWWLEDEITLSAAAQAANAFLVQAKAEFGANVKNNADGAYDVMVQNLLAAGTKNVAQDSLVLVPVPGAVLLGFLGLGYAGMRLRKMA